MSIADRWLAAESWPRNGAPILAVVIHMAEGGNTAQWLTRIDGNSSHYVVEYDGEIVQQVNETRAAGSIKASLVRTSNDAPFTFLGETIVYGVKANQAALGSYWRDPNRVVIAIEVEGWAAEGPNALQRAALKRLVADIRSRRGPIPTLGHRDFASYKACPGKRIPWVDYGGHGKRVAGQEDNVAPPLIIKGVEPASGFATVKSDGIPHAAIQIADRDLFWMPAGASKRIVFKGKIDPPWPGHPSGEVFGIGDELAIFLAEDVIPTYDTLITEQQLKDAIAADRAKARIVWS